MRDESTLPTVLRRNLPPNLEKIRKGPYDKDHDDYCIHLYLKENDIWIKEGGSEIVEFLRGKNVLVTGATGFLGKALVEKLLRCCKDIGTIYLIMRTKKGKDPLVRLNEYLDNLIFVRLSKINPHYKDKVVAISGDFEQDGIGLSEESRTLLEEKVNIIYHVAATVRFDELLKKSIQVNVKGVQEMIRLAKGCKRLDAFLHTSTAFSNCQQKVIKEEFYPPYLDAYKLISIMEQLPDDIAERVTPGLLGSLPNTYVFTKQVAEDVIRREVVGIPCCIHRPSIVLNIVTSTSREPVKSWVDNIYGPVGMIIGCGVGLVHIGLGKPKGRIDMVPLDYVVNSCIAASYKTAKDRQRDKVQIFNYTVSNDNPLYLNKFRSYADKPGRHLGSTLLINKSFFRLTACLYWYWFLNFLLHTVPAYAIDFGLLLFGKKPLLKKAYKKINKFVKALSYFTLNEWTFQTGNTTNLWDSLNETDKENFPFDMKTIDWPVYLATYLVGLRELLLFDFLDTLEAGRKLRRRLEISFYVVVTVITSLSIYYLLNTILFFIPVALISVILYYQLTE